MQGLKGFVVVGLVIAACTAGGCRTVKVSDTSGVKECLDWQADAEMLAYRIKIRYPAIASDEHKTAQDLYNRAAGSVNGYLKGVSFDLHAKNEINESKAVFLKTRAYARLKLFVDKGEELMGRSAVPVPDPVEAKSIVNFVALLLSKINEENSRQSNAAIAAIDHQLALGYSLPFGLIDDNTLKSKYEEKTLDSSTLWKKQ